MLHLSRMDRIAGAVTQLFVLWVVAASALALVWPAGFTWFQPLIVPGLGLIMFGMGMALTPADFKRVAKEPFAVGVGIAQLLVTQAGKSLTV